MKKVNWPKLIIQILALVVSAVAGVGIHQLDNEEPIGFGVEQAEKPCAEVK